MKRYNYYVGLLFKIEFNNQTQRKGHVVKMKNIKKIAIIGISACLLLSSCTQPQEAAPDYTLTENQYVDYTFEYPEAWEILRNDGMIAVGSKESNVSVSCTSFTPDNQMTTAQEYWNGYFESFRETYGDKVEVLLDEEIKLDDAPAKYVTYTAEIVDTKYQFTQVTAIRNGTAYTITYTATPELYETYKAALTHIISSFNFND